MRTLRSALALLLLTALFAISADTAFTADTKKELKQAAKKAAILEKKKAAEAKKPDPIKRPDIKADDLAKVKPLTPAFLGTKGDTATVAKFVDSQVSAKLATAKLTASPLCDDSEFLRRVYLDLAGVIPTASQARTFLDSKEPAKRAKLIDDLLASPNYAKHQADLWSNLLIRKNSDNRKVDFTSFTKWLEKEFAANRPWNEMVNEMITASGEQEKAPAVGFFLSNNGVDKMADEVGKVFLGQSIQCAQCHNHPFTDYQQTEYWALANFFVKTTAGGLNTNKGQTPGVQEVNNLKRNKKNELPESYKDVPAKFLRAEAPKMTSTEPYRPVLAKWLTSSTNPFLAKAMVNRVWSQLFGVGIVNPVDDMRADNEPSHPELLEKLAADFAANKFDLKHLHRSICNSDAYQRSSKKVSGNADAEELLFARATMKVLTPEQLFDSIALATGFSTNEGKGGKAAGGKGPGQNARTQFVTFFLSGTEMSNTTEYEPGIPQALRLMNSKPISSGRAVQSLSKADSAKAIEELYLGTLSRRPTNTELSKMQSFLKNGTTAEAYGDILWVLVNCSEFTMIR